MLSDIFGETYTNYQATNRELNTPEAGDGIEQCHKPDICGKRAKE